jgi:CheY-like chemotaxis protein
MDFCALVVDDSRLARRNAVNILARLRPDWTLHEAANAEAALDAARSLALSAALIDFNMPGEDGLSLAATLRQLHPGISIAIISANIQDSIVARTRALDIAFIAKPLTEAAIGPFLQGAALRTDQA